MWLSLQTELECAIPGPVVINSLVMVKKTTHINYGLCLYLMHKDNILH